MTHRTRSLIPALFTAAFLSPSASAQIWEVCSLAETFIGESTGDQFGWVGVGAGDVDADGVNDILVGAAFSSAAGLNAGRSYVYSGATSALLYTFDGTTGQNAGHGVAAAGDTNGDGYADVLIGAPALGGGQPGQAYLYSGFDGSLLHAFTGESNGDQFGFSVSAAGDITGDGYADVIVGAPQNDTTANNAGRAYVYSGADHALCFVIDGEAVGDNLGASVGCVGDQDGDGREEVIAGATGGGPGNLGRAYVYSDGGALECMVDADAGSVNYGLFFAGFAGDVNNDDTPDFFVSDFGHTALGGGTGRAFIYSGVDCSTILTLTGEGPGEGFGIGRGWAGDVDGDGHDDLFFGSWVSADGGPAAGKGTVHSGADGSILARYTGNIAGDNLGFDAAGMGDVDGDGSPDFLLTAATHMGATGATYLISGQPAPPSNFCDSSVNSAGTEAVMTYRRSMSMADNVFRVRVEGAVPGQPGLFIYAFSQDSVPFGDGTLCLGAPIVRLRDPENVNAQGAKQELLNFTMPPVSAGASMIQPGVRVYFQFWYRDPDAGGAGFNLSDGLSATFCP